MIYHRAPVVSDQNSTLSGSDLKNPRIGNACEVTFNGGREIDGRLSNANGLHESVA